jgi:hypothetical protein
MTPEQLQTSLQHADSHVRMLGSQLAQAGLAGSQQVHAALTAAINHAGQLQTAYDAAMKDKANDPA